MDKPKITAKDFFLWAGAVVTLYWSVIAAVLLMFNYINYALPNPLAYYPADPYQSGIPYEMASIIVLLPLALLLMWLIHRDIARDPSRGEIWVRRWAIIFTLFIAGIAMAVDLITLLTTFLGGEELTSAFLLKVLVVFLVAAGVFMHFITELRGYWNRFPMRRRSVDVAVGVAAILVIVSGFFIVGTPGQARLARFDAQKVTDLQDIQYRAINYWQAKQTLPTQINDLANSLNYGPLPVDPQTNASYTYQITGVRSFKLCATFNVQSRGNQNRSVAQPLPAGVRGATDNWQHGAGTFCFDRTIDPSFYPPLNKNVL